MLAEEVTRFLMKEDVYFKEVAGLGMHDDGIIVYFKVWNSETVDKLAAEFRIQILDMNFALDSYVIEVLVSEQKCQQIHLTTQT